MAVLAQLVEPEVFREMSRKEQERVEDWVWAEFFGSLPEAYQVEILNTPKIKQRITGLVEMCVFGEEAGQTSGIDVTRTPLGRETKKE